MPTPATIRYNNPGAQYPGPISREYGSTGYGTIGGGNRIAQFASPYQGAQAQFALLDQSYSGLTLAQAITQWSGAHGSDLTGYINAVSQATGINPNQVLTDQVLSDPNIAVPLAQAMSQIETGGQFPLSTDQWEAAHSSIFGSPNQPQFPLPIDPYDPSNPLNDSSSGLTYPHGAMDYTPISEPQPNVGGTDIANFGRDLGFATSLPSASLWDTPGYQTPSAQVGGYPGMFGNTPSLTPNFWDYSPNMDSSTPQTQIPSFNPSIGIDPATTYTPSSADVFRDASAFPDQYPTANQPSSDISSFGGDMSLGSDLSAPWESLLTNPAGGVIPPNQTIDEWLADPSHQPPALDAGLPVDTWSQTSAGNTVGGQGGTGQPARANAGESFALGGGSRWGYNQPATGPGSYQGLGSFETFPGSGVYVTRGTAMDASGGSGQGTSTLGMLGMEGITAGPSPELSEGAEMSQETFDALNRNAVNMPNIWGPYGPLYSQPNRLGKQPIPGFNYNPYSSIQFTRANPGSAQTPDLGLTPGTSDSIPSFQHGGIIHGHDLGYDTIPAMLEPGEVVLNEKEQQHVKPIGTLPKEIANQLYKARLNRKVA